MNQWCRHATDHAIKMAESLLVLHEIIAENMTLKGIAGLVR